MPIDEHCPECGGHDKRLLSPGLAECKSLIKWTELEATTVYEEVDDPAMFFNFGLHGSRPVPVQRLLEVERSRICNNRYELEASMSTALCVGAPGGATCGAFAVGMCADCSRAVCRFHGQFTDDRLLCDSCRAVVEQAHLAAAQEAERKAEVARQEAEENAARERAARTERERAAKAAYDALPTYTDADWIAILSGNAEPAGKRPGKLTRQDAIRLFHAAGKRPQRIATGAWAIPGFHGYKYVKGWVVGKTVSRQAGGRDSCPGKLGTAGCASPVWTS